MRIISIEAVTLTDEDLLKILQVPANRFRREDATVDLEGNEVCPVCGCCSLVKAKSARRYFPYYMFCRGRCTRERRHAA